MFQGRENDLLAKVCAISDTLLESGQQPIEANLQKHVVKHIIERQIFVADQWVSSEVDIKAMIAERFDDAHAHMLKVADMATDQIFEILDKDHNGKVDETEFKSGFLVEMPLILMQQQRTFQLRDNSAVVRAQTRQLSQRFADMWRKPCLKLVWGAIVAESLNNILVTSEDYELCESTLTKDVQLLKTKSDDEEAWRAAGKWGEFDHLCSQQWFVDAQPALQGVLSKALRRGVLMQAEAERMCDEVKRNIQAAEYYISMWQ
jgi:hypothetical protein